MNKSVEYPQKFGIADRPGAYILVGRSSIQITEGVCKEVAGERIKQLENYQLQDNGRYGNSQVPAPEKFCVHDDKFPAGE